MQNLKENTVLFLVRPEADERDREAAKHLAPCAFEVRHVDTPDGDIDVLIHAERDVLGEIESGDTRGRIENALRESSGHGVRHLQWVESGVSPSTGVGAGAGDGRGAHKGVSRADSGMPPEHHRDSQGHGSGQSPKQPGDTQINPPPNPRR